MVSPYVGEHRAPDSSGEGLGTLLFDKIWPCVSAAWKASMTALTQQSSNVRKEDSSEIPEEKTRIPLVKSPWGRSWPVAVQSQVPEREKQNLHQPARLLCSKHDSFSLGPKQNPIHVCSSRRKLYLPPGHSFKSNIDLLGQTYQHRTE